MDPFPHLGSTCHDFQVPMPYPFRDDPPVLCKQAGYWNSFYDKSNWGRSKAILVQMAEFRNFFANGCMRRLGTRPGWKPVRHMCWRQLENGSASKQLIPAAIRYIE
jgi:hypothetical protein